MIPHLIFLLLSLLALVKIGYDVKVNGTMNADLMLINIFGCFITVQAYSWHCLWRLIDRVIGNQSDLSLKRGHLRSDHQDQSLACFLLDMSDSGARLSIPLDQASSLYQGQTQLFFQRMKACRVTWFGAIQRETS